MDDIEWEIMRQNEEAEEAEDEDTKLQVVAVRLLTYLTRPELQPNPCEESVWQRPYHSENDCAFIMIMGLNVSAFDQILMAGFEESWNTMPIPRNDVAGTAAPCIYRQSLDAAGALGLVLHFLGSTMSEVSLQQIFALILTTTSQYINFSLSILLSTLRGIQDAGVIWPEGDKFEELTDLVIAWHPLLTGVFGTMDGLNLAVQVLKDQEIKNATYNVWLHEHFVSCMLAFASHGTVIACKLNAPGSWHDSQVAHPIYEKLQTATPEGYYLVTNTAFPCGTSQIEGHICAPMTQGHHLPADLTEGRNLEQFDRQLVYMPIWKANEQEEIWESFKNMLFSEQKAKDRVSQFHLMYST
ncbi:hypothetical protein PILCRDRAFT_97457 [Piloderma croceum F 1598]|uniref:DDE Tnp4 domain-containing protein n=1 Tax=Piloderma croceum (strain F 1598) TaxID=765440 RepID=A0A0C3FSM1_PILCF|nr:hypothetical protein PILCRDRAFT_97457 [Piloderma croceum F 1598]